MKERERERKREKERKNDRKNELKNELEMESKEVFIVKLISVKEMIKKSFLMATENNVVDNVPFALISNESQSW